MSKASWRRFIFVGMIALLLTLAFPAVTFAQPSQSSCQMNQGSNTETCTVAFVDGPTGATTTKSYSGAAQITVSGFGQAAGTQYSDAFYIYTDSAGNPVTPVPAGEFGLFINGQPATDWIGSRPPYSASHTYQFSINAAGTPLRFTFGVGDTFTADNTGSFTVTVSQPQGSGRLGQADKICRSVLPESVCMVLIGQATATSAQLQIIRQLVQRLGAAAHNTICWYPGRNLIFYHNPEFADFVCGPPMKL